MGDEGFEGLLDRLRRAHDQDVALLRHEIDLLKAQSVRAQRHLAQEGEVAFAREELTVDEAADVDPSAIRDGMQAEEEAPDDEVPATPPLFSPRFSSSSNGASPRSWSGEAAPPRQQRRLSEVWVPATEASSGGTSSAVDKDNSVSQHWRRRIKKRDSTRVVNAPSFTSTSARAKQGDQLKKIVDSRAYEMFVIFMVFLNAVFIGVEVQYFALYYQTVPYRDLVEGVFTLVFSVELALRIYVHRWAFIAPSSQDFIWNLFDMSVVIFMVGDLVLLHVMTLDTNTLSSVSVLRVVRVIRVTRAFRVIRLLKFFRELRLMISSMMTSVKPLLWTMLVLMVLFYIFGIMLTQGTSFHCSDTAHACIASDGRRLQERFGSLDTSILSLFEAMSNGVSWGLLYEILGPLSISYRVIFILYISFALFAMVNVVTSVFVDGAVQSSNRDHDNLIQEELRHKEEYIASMHTLFVEMDNDSSGNISLDEFRQAIHDERIVAYFHVLGLAIEDVETLFVLLDRDRTGSIDIEEFLLGCMKLKGEAKSLDMAKLTYESEWLVHNVEDLTQRVSNLIKVVSELQWRAPHSDHPPAARGKPEQLAGCRPWQASCGQPPSLDCQKASL